MKVIVRTFLTHQNVTNCTTSKSVAFPPVFTTLFLSAETDMSSFSVCFSAGAKRKNNETYTSYQYSNWMFRLPLVMVTLK